MKLLALEFCKCRRRKLTLVCAGLLAAQLLWFGAYLTRQDAEALAQGWMLLLYNLAMVDAIMLPIGVAVIASRSCELEHRGHTLKLLETAVTPGRLYAAKLAWGARSRPASTREIGKEIGRAMPTFLVKSAEA